MNAALVCKVAAMFSAALLLAEGTAAADGVADPGARTQGSVPAYVRLAYQPVKSVSMLDLPKDFVAAQVMTVSSRERLEDYVNRYRLVGVSGARVAQGGELRYVLLLGIYETRELADQATKGLPSPLDKLDVWMRPMASLQRAIMSADELAGAESN